MANKFITTDLGGLPFELDDYRFFEQAEADSVEGIGSGFLAPVSVANSYILSGTAVTVNGLNLDIAEGFIMFAGEVIKVDTHSIVDQGTGATYWFKLDTSSDPAGLKVFQDLSPHYTYEVRRMILTNDVLEALPGSFFVFNRTTLNAENMQNLLGRTSWTTIDLEASADVIANDLTSGAGTDTALSILPQAGSFLKYRIVGKTVHISFRLISFRPVPFDTNAAGSVKIGNLPFVAEGLQFGTYFALSTNQGGALNGVQPMRFTASTSALVLNVNRIDTATGYFNVEYVQNDDVSGTGIIKGHEILSTASNITWTAQGSMTLEIQ